MKQMRHNPVQPFQKTRSRDRVLLKLWQLNLRDPYGVFRLPATIKESTAAWLRISRKISFFIWV